MKDAQTDRDTVERDYKMQSQHFAINGKLKEVMEDRKSRAEQYLKNLQDEFAKVAQEAEPLLAKIHKQTDTSTPISTAINEDDTKRLIKSELRAYMSEDEMRKAIKSELREYVRFRSLDTELDNLKKDQDISNLRVLKKELKDFTRYDEHRRLSDQVQELQQRRRRSASVSEPELGPQLQAHSKEIENLKRETSERFDVQNMSLDEIKKGVIAIETDEAVLNEQLQKLSLDVQNSGLAMVLFDFYFELTTR
jgi:hypothetical protein